MRAFFAPLCGATTKTPAGRGRHEPPQGRRTLTILAGPNGSQDADAVLDECGTVQALPQ